MLLDIFAQGAEIDSHFSRVKTKFSLRISSEKSSSLKVTMEVREIEQSFCQLYLFIFHVELLWAIYKHSKSDPNDFLTPLHLIPCPAMQTSLRHRFIGSVVA